MREDVEVCVAERKAKDFKDATISRHATVDADRGRIETRTTTMIHDVAWLQQRHNWPGLQGIIIVESQREIGGKVAQETRFYITSLVLLAQAIGPMVRSRWAAENSLHWIMDVVFRDDERRIRAERAPANFTTLRHMAHTLVRKAPGKDSLRSRALLTTPFADVRLGPKGRWRSRHEDSQEERPDFGVPRADFFALSPSKNRFFHDPAAPLACAPVGNAKREMSEAIFSRPILAHVPKKLLDFFDKDLLQLFEFERFLFDHVILRDREAL